ncbi:sigma-70 family RNA polymerase sigma factor [Leucobacter sp. NPDC077196]|uniref:sigma-70 family RNA polymerase sigma factor n=1 Tax=Leucobacter sp. NPDC077196 TaxID=3154959 RepID=UPI0034333BB7
MHDAANADRSDAELLDIVRAGDPSAFALLWQRHSRAGRTAARHMSSASHADDILSEAYLRIFELVLTGRGPRGAFRPYLYRTIRSIAADRWSSPEESSDDLDHVPDLTEAGPWEDGAFDRNAAARAFGSLNERWQAVLWYTEVEGMPPREVAKILGLSANAVSALAKRAREALQSAWVEVHVDRELRHAECRTTLDHLQRYQRGKLTAAASRAVSAHLDSCDDCARAAAEFAALNRQLALVLVGILLGGGTTFGFLGGSGAATPATAAGFADGAPAGSSGSEVAGPGSSGGSPPGGAASGSAGGSVTAGTVTGGILGGVSGTLLLAAATAAALVVGGGALYLSRAADASSNSEIVATPSLVPESEAEAQDPTAEDQSERGSEESAEESAEDRAEQTADESRSGAAGDDAHEVVKIPLDSPRSDPSGRTPSSPAGEDGGDGDDPDHPASPQPGLNPIPDPQPAPEPQPDPEPQPEPQPDPEPQPQPEPEPQPEPIPEPDPQDEGDPSLTPIDPRWARCSDGSVYIEGRSALLGALVFARVVHAGQVTEHPEQMQVLGDARWYSSSPVFLPGTETGAAGATLEIQLRLADGRASPWTQFPLEAMNELDAPPAQCIIR